MKSNFSPIFPEVVRVFFMFFSSSSQKACLGDLLLLKQHTVYDIRVFKHLDIYIKIQWAYKEKKS